ncbi:hypothetical protein EVAR_63846_1 [Eumeta japonica]|uniref:Uncharacterized protein n=1 Tax=Eumeta variegata TaxID=151549 RepID=A0A4C1YYT1_EUMVA|nr:hypothetical protein EVAR_63846_1 [Eumeta japonica]
MSTHLLITVIPVSREPQSIHKTAFLTSAKAITSRNNTIRLPERENGFICRSQVDSVTSNCTAKCNDGLCILRASRDENSKKGRQGAGTKTLGMQKGVPVTASRGGMREKEKRRKDLFIIHPDFGFSTAIIMCNYLP